MTRRPKKGTPDWELWVAALEVAIYPPVKGQRATTQVARSRIEALRSAFDAVGIDWRETKAVDDERRAESERAKRARRALRD